MGLVETVAEWNARADDWLQAHPVAFLLAFATPPGLAFAALELARGGHLSRALVLGAAFGVTFAGVSLVLRRRRS